MAITIAHPAIAIPLRRCGLSLSALIVGSMVPDFEFFLRLSTGRGIGHTLPGLFLFCVPVGLATLWIFHKVLKFPLLSLLPRSQQVRLIKPAQEFSFFPFNRFFLIILSIIIGAITHLFWDSFTHPDGWMVLHAPLLLSATIFTFHASALKVYFALQYGTSAIGLWFMWRWYKGWYVHAEPHPEYIPHNISFTKRIFIGLSMGAFSFSFGLTFGIFSLPGHSGLDMIRQFISHASVASISGIFVALVAFGALWHHFIPAHRRIQFRVKVPVLGIDQT